MFMVICCLIVLCQYYIYIYIFVKVIPRPARLDLTESKW
jgi:hypothetical protein